MMSLPAASAFSVTFVMPRRPLAWVNNMVQKFDAQLNRSLDKRGSGYVCNVPDCPAAQTYTQVGPDPLRSSIH